MPEWLRVGDKHSVYVDGSIVPTSASERKSWIPKRGICDGQHLMSAQREFSTATGAIKCERPRLGTNFSRPERPFHTYARPSLMLCKGNKFNA